MLKTFLIDSTLADYTSAEFAWLQSLLLEEGVFGDSAGTMGLQVTQNSPTGMSVLVSAGNALVELTKNGTTWKVVVLSNAQATVTVPANSSGSNRVDAVILRVDKDAEPNALKNNIATIELVQGTGTSALTDGAIDTAVGSDGWIRLADITVANAASSIVNADIADKRAQVKTNDSFRPATKKLAFITVAADPSGADLVEGLLWFNSTDHTLKYYDGTSVQAVITNLLSTSGTAISGSNKVVDNADTGTSGANKVLRLDGSGKLPAVSGENLTNIFKGVFKSGAASHDISVTGSQTIAHGLGVVPKFIRITASCNPGTNAYAPNSVGVYNGTTVSTLYNTFNSASNSGANPQPGTTASYIIYIDTQAYGTNNNAGASVGVDATNITLTWAKTGSPTGTVQFMWEAFA